MYATVRSYTTGSEFGDALVEHAEELRPTLTEIVGFRAYYLVRTADGVVSVSVYDDEAGAEESTRVARAWVAENLPDLEVSPPQVQTGEVALNF
jgi:heme-degrading monooxygenase HmoA